MYKLLIEGVQIWFCPSCRSATLTQDEFSPRYCTQCSTALVLLDIHRLLQLLGD